MSAFSVRSHASTTTTTRQITDPERGPAATRATSPAAQLSGVSWNTTQTLLERETTTADRAGCFLGGIPYLPPIPTLCTAHSETPSDSTASAPAVRTAIGACFHGIFQWSIRAKQRIKRNYCRRNDLDTLDGILSSHRKFAPQVPTCRADWGCTLQELNDDYTQPGWPDRALQFLCRTNLPCMDTILASRIKYTIAASIIYNTTCVCPQWWQENQRLTKCLQVEPI